jgi:DNA mismatch repair protein PMS2
MHPSPELMAALLTHDACKEVRFKNQGLDSIEVQDNGSGIAPHNYESVALKHYTSKLASYDDLSELRTFGFRGEALSSLCALSRFFVVTCTQEEAPRATKLEFETSGKLGSTSVVSGQRGTTVIVEDLFRNLPVRRRELERNIKREWGKVINLLNQYACVQTGIKFTVSQQPTKGKRMVLFSTKGNPTTRENIINVFGVKTMNALIAMDLKLELVPTTGPLNKGKSRADGSATEVRVVGHISRPAHGEGRQTPDRQMFYVNGRPCGLPQFAKVFNEVYRLYNSSQSPFIFADIQLDTHLYDVNVSPDKRTILLHDQGQMLDNLRESLIELFETQDVTVPITQAAALKQTPLKKAVGSGLGTLASVQRGSSRSTTVAPPCRSEASSPTSHRKSVEESGEFGDEEDSQEDVSDEEEENVPRTRTQTTHKPASSVQNVTLLSRWLAKTKDGRKPLDTGGPDARQPADTVVGDILVSTSKTARTGHQQKNATAEEPASPVEGAEDEPEDGQASRMEVDENEPESPVPAVAPPSQPPAPRHNPIGTARPFNRSTQQVATITIGDDTVTSLVGNRAKRPRIEESSKPVQSMNAGKAGRQNVVLPSFGGRLSQLFSAYARPDEGPVDGAGIAVEDLDQDIGVADQEDREEVDESGEDDEEDSLFVSQPDHKPTGEEEVGRSEELPAGGQVPGTGQAEDVEALSHPGSPLDSAEHPESRDDDYPAEDTEYIDEDEKKAREDKKVQEMIDTAEAAATEVTEEGEKRSQLFIKGRSRRKDMTANLVQQVKTDEGDIQQRIAALKKHLPQPHSRAMKTRSSEGLEAEDAEEKLSLKIAKSDFAKMRIVGQFNLGFILAVREAAPSSEDTPQTEDDELFIIDQHASDEKYNFERLQASTTVQSQRLVQPKTLELTALEEEIILEHQSALERNGFLVQIDTSGDKPVGSRVQLLSLPLSRETTFSVSDLEELIVLLADNPTSSATTIPRPSKVRKMFAMRACRSSIMIGRALSRSQMEKVVRHMGEMEKPWNCPHGRPTMRHLCGLGGAWDERAWMEGDGPGFDECGGRTDWAGWVREKKKSVK